jgi:hypothetical protein
MKVVFIGIVIIFLVILYQIQNSEGFQSSNPTTQVYGVNIITSLDNIFKLNLDIFENIVDANNPGVNVWKKGEPPVSSTKVSKYYLGLSTIQALTRTQLNTTIQQIKNTLNTKVGESNYQAVSLTTDKGEYPSEIIASIDMSGGIILSGIHIITSLDMLNKFGLGNVDSIVDDISNSLIWKKGDSPVSNTKISKYLVKSPDIMTPPNEFDRIIQQIKDILNIRIGESNYQAVSLDTGKGEYPSVIKINDTPGPTPPPINGSTPPTYPVDILGAYAIVNLQEIATILLDGAYKITNVDTNKVVWSTGDEPISSTDITMYKYLWTSQKPTIINDVNEFNTLILSAIADISTKLSRPVSVAFLTSLGDFPTIKSPVNPLDPKNPTYNPIDCQMGQSLNAIKNNLKNSILPIQAVSKLIMS